MVSTLSDDDVSIPCMVYKNAKYIMQQNETD